MFSVNKKRILLDMNTGEIVERRKGDNFVKMYKKNMIKMFEVIGGKKAQVVIYILNNLQLSNNTLIKTQREIAEYCKVSTKTVNETLTDLRKKGILKKKSGAYMLSPDVFYRGDDKKGAYLLSEFNSFESKLPKS